MGGWAREAGGGGGEGAVLPKLPYKPNNWEAGEGCTRCGGLKNLWWGGWVGGPGLEKGEERVWGHQDTRDVGA